MAEAWHDINEPGAFVRNEPGEASAQVSPAEDPPAQTRQEQQAEISLTSAQWEKGPDGYAFNAKCCLSISARILQPTVRRRLQVKLYVVFNGAEEDLGGAVYVNLLDDGSARAELTLFYGNAYYDALAADPSATCQYKAVITHPGASSALSSPLLDMPAARKVFRLTLKDEFGGALANTAYRFVAQDRALRDGRTDSRGRVEFDPPLGIREGRLVIAGVSIPVSLQPPPSIGTMKGIQARLNGLGFDAGKVDGRFGPKTWNALRAFQVSAGGLQPTGKVDDDTRRKLLESWDRDTEFSAPQEDLTFKG
jgi:hypothetical protein